jgi:hypothetical protein
MVTLVYCTKKNLATLLRSTRPGIAIRIVKKLQRLPIRTGQKFREMKKFRKNFFQIFETLFIFTLRLLANLTIITV